MNDVRILARDLGFPEGPVAMADGSVVLTDIRGGRVVRVAADGHVATLSPAGGGPNGLAVGPDGALYCCNNGGGSYRSGSFMSIGPAPDYAGGSIQRIDAKTGASSVLYTHCGEHKLSAPNDLVFDRHGGFYFTDLGKRYARQRDHGGVYYAMPDGSRIVEAVYPMLTPNGCGLSPDEKTLYVADTESCRLLAYAIEQPGVVRKEPFPSPSGGRVVAGLGGVARFDSLAVLANGDICVATLGSGHVTVISPDGRILRQVKMPDSFPTNICFGGPNLRTAYITLSENGQLGAMDWPESGLKLNYS
jgi:gluconolactonase